MLYPQQNQYRDLSILDGVWQFRLDPDDVGLNSKWHDGFTESRPIVVPSSWNELFPDTYDYIGVGWYQTSFSIPGSWSQDDLRLRFGSVTYKATVWINGQLLGSHEGGNLPRVAERFAFIFLSMIPPILVVVFLQRWFIKGLIQTEK